jgi:5'-3' exonuclease
MGKLLAIDGLNIVRRVYEANHDEDDRTIRAGTAVRHALSSFKKLLNFHQPSHVLPAFDYGGSTWRHLLYPQYQEKREPMPQELKQALPILYQNLAALGLTVVSLPEVEADDVIATAILRWLRDGRGEAIIASTDKDLHQLIADGAMLWDHFKGEWHDSDWVQAKFGVPPPMLGQLLSLMGDAADGIPGVSKVGVKTAAKLINAYGSLDAVMAGAGILPGPLGQRLRKERDILDLSCKLVALKTDVVLGVTWNMLAFDAAEHQFDAGHY